VLAAMIVFDASRRDGLAVEVSGKESGRVCKTIVNAFILPFGFRPSKRQQNDIFLSHAFGIWAKNYLSLAPMPKRVASICLDIRAAPQSLNIYAQICETSNRTEASSETVRTVASINRHSPYFELKLQFIFLLSLGRPGVQKLKICHIYVTKN